MLFQKRRPTWSRQRRGPFFKNIGVAPEEDARSQDITVETREGRLFRTKLRRKKLKSVLDRQLWCNQEGDSFSKTAGIEHGQVYFDTTFSLRSRLSSNTFCCSDKGGMLFQ